MEKIKEIWEELQAVLIGRTKILDSISILPPVVCLLGMAWLSFELALIAALSLGVISVIWRVVKGQPVVYALVGFVGVALAVGIAWLLGTTESFFLPDIITNGIVVVSCVGSVVAKKPMVAWTSWITRRRPWNWYWHERVRPAYSEVTLAWGVFFAMRLFLQWLVYSKNNPALFGAVNVLSGWPATSLLLIFGYLYGVWRLQKLQGPSVEEFQQGKEPPWVGQKWGF
jgi:hypothetical protein